MTSKVHHTSSRRRRPRAATGFVLGALALFACCEDQGSSAPEAPAPKSTSVGDKGAGLDVSAGQPTATGTVTGTPTSKSPRRGRDFDHGAVLFVQEAMGGAGDLWRLWACDASNMQEGRPGAERMGCMVRLPGTHLRQALYTPPSRAASVDVHTFLMGAQRDDPNAPGHDAEASADEGPPHEVTLSPFWMHQLAVSVRQYQWCLSAGPCKPKHVGSGGRFHFRNDEAQGGLSHAKKDSVQPVNGVTWEGARRYCEWIGGRLPTEAEWEYAARGGPLQLRYPWGDEAPTCQHAFYGGGPARLCPVKRAVPVNFQPARGHDTHSFILHQAGNVWEWTADWYAEDYYARSPKQDPRGPETGTGRVQRGGGWSDDDPAVLRGANRSQMDPTLKMPDVGFRCAADAVERASITELDSFDGPLLDGWRPLGAEDAGAWSQSHGMVVGKPAGTGVTARWRRAPLASPTLLSARVFSGLGYAGSVSVLYGVQDARNHYRAEVYPMSSVARIIRVLDGVEGVVAEASRLEIPRGIWFVLNVSWANGRHSLDYGAIHLVTGEEDTWSTGGYGLRVTGPGSATFGSLFTTP